MTVNMIVVTGAVPSQAGPSISVGLSARTPEREL